MPALAEVKPDKFYMLITRITLSLLVRHSSVGMLASHTLTALQLPMPEVAVKCWCLATAFSSLQQVCCIFLSLRVARWTAGIIWSVWRTWRTCASEDATKMCLYHRRCGLDFKELRRSEWDNSIWIVRCVIIWMNELTMLIVLVSASLLYA